MVQIKNVNTLIRNSELELTLKYADRKDNIVIIENDVLIIYTRGEYQDIVNRFNVI